MAREKFLNRLKEKYPDKDYTDNDDELFNDINAEYEELSEYKTKNTDVNKRLLSVLNQHPEITSFIKDVEKGASVPEALARNFDLENIEPVEGDPDYEGWGKAKEERAGKMAEREKYQETLNSNIEMSAKTMNDFVAKNDLSEEKALEFFSMVDAIMKDAVDGKIEEKTLTALYTAANHDEVVKDEVEKATVKAKNEKIEEEIAKENDKKGDGLPHATSGDTVKAEEKEPDDMFIKAASRQRKI